MTNCQSRPAQRLRILGNAFYLLLAQVAMMLSPAVAVIMVARNMSVAEFAAISFALALVAVAVSVMTAGISGLAIREITSGLAVGVDEASGTLKSIIALREIFSCVGTVGILMFAFTTQSSIGVVTLTAILSVSLFFRAADAIEFWQQAHEVVSRFVIIRVIVLVLSTVVRVVLILNGAGLTLIAWSLVVESAALATTSLIYNRRSCVPVNFRSKAGHSALMLIKISWVLLLSGLLAQLSMRMGVIYLGSFSQDRELANFAAASRLTEFAFVLPVVVTTASFPRLLRTRAEHGRESQQYRSELQRSLTSAFWVGSLFSICGVAVGPHLIPLLFGNEYSAAVPVFQVTVITLPFVFMGAVLSKWIIAENLLRLSLWRNLLGLILNIILLVLLAPQFGAMGAASAYLSSYIATNYISFFWSKDSRLMAYSMTTAILWPVFFPVSFIRNRNGKRSREWSND